MFKNLLLLIAVFGLTTSMMAQTLRGTVTDDLGEALPFANVSVKLGDQIVRGTATDFDGNYIITPLDPGTYNVEFSFVGYQPVKLNGVLISAGVVTEKNVSLQTGETLDAVVLTDEQDLIQKDNTSGKTVSREQLTALPTRSVNSIAANTAGVSQKDEGGDLNVRGGRDEQTVYYVDGVKMFGAASIPNSALDQIQVITGGLPAEYGDATSGIISITTRAPSPNKSGGIEVQTSELLDDYGFTVGEFYYTGPLLWNKTEKDTSVLAGLFLSGNFTHVKDPTYSRRSYELNDAGQDLLIDGPLVMGGSPATPFGASAIRDVVSDQHLDELSYRKNRETDSWNMQTKINFKTGKNSSLKVGGNYSYSRSSRTGFASSVFNSEQRGERENNDYTLYANFVQYFEDDTSEEGRASIIKNAYYTVKADYQANKSETQDSKFGDEYAKYGYVGKFTPVFNQESNSFIQNLNDIRNISFYNNITNENEEITVTFADQSAEWRDAFSVSHWNFEGSTLNPDKVAYTQQYFDFADNAGQADLNQIGAGGGLINGGQPVNIYNLWSPNGTNYNNASKFDRSQFRLTGAASAMIKEHQLKIGFEYEKRTRRFWAVTPNRIWSIGRLLANSYISDGSIKRYEFNGLVNDQGQLVLDEYTDLSNTVVTGFAKNARDLLGVDYEDYLNIDGMNPGDLDLNLFSAEELLEQRIVNGRAAGVNGYYGYDPYGNEITDKITMDDFLNDSLANGNLKREIGAFEPIYIAGYIQDKFFVRDLVFNIGLRIDRYDANQQVLKDQYTIFDAFSAGEIDFTQLGNGTYAKPSSIGDNYVVYVDNINDPSRVTGYRNGDDWYNAEGNLITDVSTIYSDGRAQPYLKPDAREGLTANNGLTGAGFKDYDPDITVMPRVSFNFPISDEAMFYAFYDIKTLRPSAGNSRLNPINYLDLALGEQGVIATNPDLKPQKTTDYEMGFKQKISDNATIDLSAFYREQRDMIQLTNINDAYPATYTTFGNLDFGTVKGMSIAFEMRRVGNVRFNANYTLQFADGSGSSATSGLNLVNSGQPNLRTTLPLSFDSRHQLQSVVDYRFGGGRFYNGPKKLQKVLENTSAVLSFSAQSGNPYSKFTEAVPLGNSRTTLDGTPNGARLPWTYRIDLKLQKQFNLNLGKDGKKKAYPMTVYLQVNNLLDVENVNNVYAFTGNADDDGYLDSAAGQQAASEQENEAAYRSLYTLYMQNNPNNFLRPRTIRLGLTMNFQ